MKSSKTYVAIPPGYSIKEQLVERGLTQKEFAMRMELSEKHISKLINGEVLLTTDVAVRLEMVLGIEAQFWLNLEAIYREKLFKIEEENNMENDIKIASKFPYKEMSNLNWIPKTNKVTEKVINLRKFFEVNRLGLLLENNNLNVLWRRISESEKSNYALLAWAQKAKLEARSHQTSPININYLSNNIPLFRKMTNQRIEDFYNTLVDELKKSGISLVLLPHLEGSYLHGATFYDKNKIVVALSTRGKDADRFWFSFFHEIGHIVLGHINEDYNKQMEIDADKFAQDTLIPSDKYKDFVSLKNFTEQRIIDFANEIGVDQGIIIGRLQKDGLLSFKSLNHLKTKYII